MKKTLKQLADEDYKTQKKLKDFGEKLKEMGFEHFEKYFNFCRERFVGERDLTLQTIQLSMEKIVDDLYWFQHSYFAGDIKEMKQKCLALYDLISKIENVNAPITYLHEINRGIETIAIEKMKSKAEE